MQIKAALTPRYHFSSNRLVKIQNLETFYQLSWGKTGPHLHCFCEYKMAPTLWGEIWQSLRESPSWLCPCPFPPVHGCFSVLWDFHPQNLGSFLCLWAWQAGNAWVLIFSGNSCQPVSPEHGLYNSSGEIILRPVLWHHFPEFPFRIKHLSQLGQQAQENTLSCLRLFPGHEVCFWRTQSKTMWYAATLGPSNPRP